MQANIAAFQAGWNFGETTEDFAVSYEVKPAQLPTGTYRNISGNLALSYGLVAASQRTGLPLFLGSYPITPASDILHELSKHKRFGVRTFQAEDEIAGIGAALGAAFGGSLAVTTTSGPGVALKSETIGLAVSLELPLIVVDVQRGGPSTGLPTKTEQADLLQAMFGRNGEAPVPIVAPRVARRLLRRRAGGGPDRDDLPHAGVPALRRLPGQRLRAVADPRGRRPARPAGAVRDRAQRRGRRQRRSSGPTCATRETLARPWAVPGTPGLEHRIGGIEKADGTGNISYDPANHDFMVRTRQAKVDGIAATIPPLEVDDPSRPGPGPRARLGLDVRPDRRRLPPGPARRRPSRPGPPAPPQPVPGQPRRGAAPLRQGGRAGDEPRPARRQLSMLVRAKYLVDAISYNQVRGLPFKAEELRRPSIKDVIDSDTCHGRPSSASRSLYAGAQGTRQADGQGLQVRPGGPLVPGLRRLRDPRGRPGLHARARAGPGEHRLRLRHRLLVPLPVLHEHLRDALDPRPRPGDRHRPGRLAAGPVGVGGHRRRRRAVHRRQPPDPRAAPQREPEDPAVQQPDLRPDQGPVLPHLRGRQDHQVDADGLAGRARSTRCRWRSAPRRPSWPARSTPTASTSRRCCGRPPPTAAPRWSRSTRTATSSTTAPSSRSRTRSTRDEFTIRLEHGQPIRFGADGEHGVVRDPDTALKVVDVADGRRRPTLVVHDAHADDPSHAFALSRLADHTLARTPIGVFRDVDRPVYDDLMPDQLERSQQTAPPRAPATATPWPRCSPARTPGRSS